MQAASLEDYAQRNGFTIVARTADLDVSGGKPIRERPGIGPWLTPEHLDEWDAIAGYSIDRMFRNLHDFVTFYYDFLQPHGKKLVAVADEIDMSTPEGEERATMRVLFAQSELRRISERNRRSAAWFRTQGYWKGGQIPFGYMPKQDGRHFILVPHPQHKKIIRQIAQDIIEDGRSVSEIARELTVRKIPTGRKRNGQPSTKWVPGPLIRLLRSEVLKGYVPYNFRKDGSYDLLRDRDGMIVRREAILDDETWTRLQEALARPAQRGRGRRPDASLLLHVAKCAKCGAWLYYNAFTARGTTYRYYVCSGECGERSIPAEELETWLDAWFTIGASEGGAFGDTEIWEKIFIPGHDHRDEMAALAASVRELDLDDPEYDAKLARFREARENLKVLPSESARVDERPTGLVLKDYWPTLDAAGKRSYLLNSGVVIHARREEDGRLDVWMTGNPAKVVGTLRYTRKAEAR